MPVYADGAAWRGNVARGRLAKPGRSRNLELTPLVLKFRNRPNRQTNILERAMNSQKIAGLLAGIIGLVAICFAFFYGPSKQPAAKLAVKIEAPKAPASPVLGPVVRDVTPNK